MRASHQKNPARSAHSVCTFPQHSPGPRRPDRRWRRQRFHREFVPSISLRRVAPATVGVLGSAFNKLQTGSLATVAQPFHQHNSLFVIEEHFLVPRLFLRSVCSGYWLPLFQNGYKSIFARREEIADLAGIQKCDRLLDHREISRFVFLRFFLLRLWFLLFNQ